MNLVICWSELQGQIESQNKIISDLQHNTNDIHHQYQDTEHKLEAANKQIEDLKIIPSQKSGTNKILLSKKLMRPNPVQV